MHTASCLLSSAYFAPIQWYQKLFRYDSVLLEKHDNFIKQTYRNRCVIATANGPQVLTVPIERYEGSKCKMKDIRISDHGNWRHIHWNALRSAYGDSPFFEFYADDLCPFFERKWDYLFDFNLDITRKLCELLDIDAPVLPTTAYGGGFDAEQGQPTDMPDFRDAIRPKHPLPDADFSPRCYYQVYEHKYGFLPNLSILDLLLNMGNEAVLYL